MKIMGERKKSLYEQYKNYEIKLNKRPTVLNSHLMYQRLYTDFFSEGLIFAYQQAHHRINKSTMAEGSCIITPSYKRNQCAVY